MNSGKKGQWLISIDDDGWIEIASQSSDLAFLTDKNKIEETINKINVFLIPSINTRIKNRLILCKTPIKVVLQWDDEFSDRLFFLWEVSARRVLQINIDTKDLEDFTDCFRQIKKDLNSDIHRKPKK